KYFYIIPNEWANKSNRKCICRACIDAVGRDFALQNDDMKITNTKCYCANHLRDCPYFAAKHSPEQIQLIFNSAISSTPNKQVMISYTNKEDEDENDSTSGLTSSNSLALNNTLISKNKPHYSNILTLVTKDDMASDNDLKLPTEIKIAVNRDSFWDSLTTLYKILRPFCGSFDLMQ
ncbi:24970_t:CDS:2, partial [Gigaspora rosea]